MKSYERKHLHMRKQEDWFLFEGPFISGYPWKKNSFHFARNEKLGKHNFFYEKCKKYHKDMT